MIEQHTIEQLSVLAKQADETGMLLPEQLNIIYKEDWFKIFVPKSFGGLELSLVEGLELQESLSKIDGSLGWTVTLCSGASQFIGYLPPQLMKGVFKDEKVCFGGSGALSGTARKTNEGYTVNGFWKYATGSPYATHFTANCRLEKEGTLLVDVAGEPVYKSFLFTRAEVEVYKDWNSMGLKATASNSFSVTELNVPKERAFRIDPVQTTLNGTIYKYPFLQFAEATLAVNTFGMTQHFLEELETIIDQKSAIGQFTNDQYDLMQSRLNMANNHLQKLRARFYATMLQSWDFVVEGKEIPEEVLNNIAHLSRGLTKSSREMVGDLYPYCGVGATQNGSVINRIFRDIFTASQHLLLNL